MYFKGHQIKKCLTPYEGKQTSVHMCAEKQAWITHTFAGEV